MSIMAVIPARSGSKGIKDKNIRNFYGYPMIAWSIAVAKLSKKIDRVIVSTDSQEYADIAKYYGAEVPFLRPKEISQDNSKDIDFFLHLLDWLKNNENIVPDYLIHLRPTSPLRIPSVIDEAIDLMLDNKEATALLSAHSMGYPGEKFLKIENGYFNGITGKMYINYPRQELIQTYQGNAYVDIVLPKQIMDNDIYGNKVLPFITDNHHDIDDISDLKQLTKEKDIIVNCKEISDYLSNFKPYFGKYSEYFGIPKTIKCIIFDFDGVFTDNKVIINQEGIESVVCNRSDGLAIEMIKKKGIHCIVLSKETNKVVKARCDKLKIECFNGVDNKLDILKDILDKYNYTLDDVIYMGNDINDLECIKYVKYSVAPADAYDSIKKEVSIVLKNNGGNGAIREFVDKYII